MWPLLGGRSVGQFNTTKDNLNAIKPIRTVDTFSLTCVFEQYSSGRGKVKTGQRYDQLVGLAAVLNEV